MYYSGYNNYTNYQRSFAQDGAPEAEGIGPLDGIAREAKYLVSIN
jgi:hypothetical protein